jgi:hypothetical protein
MQDLKAIRFISGTKISHDYNGKDVTTFSYRELCGIGADAIGIPAKQNRLIIIDVDVAGITHKKDGREWWKKFSQENGVPVTYTVRTPSGGYHYYFKLPDAINAETFAPPGQLAPGVDVKWNGWVGAPPTPGYQIEFGNITNIVTATPAMMMHFSKHIKSGPVHEFDGVPAHLDLHTPYNEAQLKMLRTKLEWIQAHGTLSYHEWRDGLFALKAGVDDQALLDELVDKWTFNRSYQPGDEHNARSLVAKANKHGGIGPGSIFNIIRSVEMREGAPAMETPWTTQEIIDKSKIQYGFNKDGSMKIESSESNAAALIGAIFDDKTLYHDERNNHYVFKGQSYSDTDLVNMIIPMIQSPVFGLGLEKFRRATIQSGLDVLMARRRKDPHHEFLKNLEWDGKPRIEKFFQTYAHVDDSAYMRMVGKNLWTALAARGLNPGCKFDSMIVIEGHEGIRKSSLVEAIGGGYTYAPFQAKAFQNLDDLRQMHQSIVVELPELIGLINQPAEQVKAFLSKPFDDMRDLYARKAMKKKRGFVFIGTTNSDRYLSIDMGARRFWPVKIDSTKSIDLLGIKADRAQLFAEGVYWYNQGHKYYDMPDELVRSIVKNKVIREPLIEPIKDIVKMFGDSCSVMDIYKSLESNGMIQRGFNQSAVNRIETALSMLGHKRNPGTSRWEICNATVEMFI